jgi:putative transposase
MPQSLVSMHVHIVFSTKNRAPWIDAELQPRLYGYGGGIVRGETGRMLTIGGMPDHVHLLVSMGRTVCIADLVRAVKSNSSRWVHEMFPSREFAWQAGYGAFSVSESQLSVVRYYIENQAQHHRSMTYQDEFRELLQKHGIEWDEKYVWD